MIVTQAKRKIISMFTQQCTHKSRSFSRRLVSVVFSLCLWVPSQAFAAGTLNFYSHRQQALIQPFLDTFTETTGIKTKTIFAAEGLAQQLYGTINYECSVNLAVASPTEHASRVTLKRDLLPIERLAELSPKAQPIIDRIAW